MSVAGGDNNQALIATLSRVKAVSQLSAVAPKFFRAKLIVSHVELRPDFLIGGGLPLLAPADFLERI